MANGILFDKLAYVDRLTKAGVAEIQARAMGEAMDEALRESVATKNDLRRETDRLENQIQLAVRDLKIWIGGVAFLLFGALVAVRFFIR